VTLASRAKGVKGEREVAKIWQAAGFEVRGLEGQGDHLVMTPTFEWRAVPVPSIFHCETKRQERLRLPEWLAQAKREAPQGTIPVVCFRQNKGEWYACLSLASLVELAS